MDPESTYGAKPAVSTDSPPLVTFDGLLTFGSGIFLLGAAYQFYLMSDLLGMGSRIAVPWLPRFAVVTTCLLLAILLECLKTLRKIARRAEANSAAVHEFIKNRSASAPGRSA